MYTTNTGGMCRNIVTQL